MKVKSLALTLALCFAGAAVSLAQSPQMGTWKLNEAKSKVPANYTKSTTVSYEMAGDSVKVTTEGTDATGKPLHTEWTGKFDGKDYPLTGDPTADSRMYTKVSDRTLAMTNKMGSKEVVKGRIVVSADGKTRTLKTNSMDSAGKKMSGMAFYDKE
jgi:hypothetical protein